MNHNINHERFVSFGLVKKYSVTDMPKANCRIMPNSVVSSGGKLIIPELTHHENEWAELIPMSLMMLFGLSLSFLFVETGIIDFGRGSGAPIFSTTWILPLTWFIYLNIFYFLIKHFADLRYLQFQGDKVILQSRYIGRRVYEANDLIFILLKIGSEYHRYQLEVEIPDPTIPEERRRIILETAANLEKMNGILAVLFPLMRGDIGPYNEAKERDFFALTPDEKSNLWKRWQHFKTQLHVWFLDYKVNEILFKIVHGSREKLLAKEKKRMGL